MNANYYIDNITDNILSIIEKETRDIKNINNNSDSVNLSLEKAKICSNLSQALMNVNNIKK